MNAPDDTAKVETQVLYLRRLAYQERYDRRSSLSDSETCGEGSGTGQLRPEPTSGVLAEGGCAMTPARPRGGAPEDFAGGNVAVTGLPGPLPTCAGMAEGA